MTGMVAFASDADSALKSSPRACGQDRSCISAFSRFLKARTQSNLRHAIYGWRARLVTCSRDPIGYKGSKWNLFEYCESQPNRKADPYGKDSYWIGGSNPLDHSTICVDKQGGGFYCCALGAIGRGKSSGSSSCGANRNCSTGGGEGGFWSKCGFAAAACGVFVHPIGITCNSLPSLPTGQKITIYPQEDDEDIDMEKQLRKDSGGTWYWNGVFSSCHTYVATR